MTNKKVSKCLLGRSTSSECSNKCSQCGWFEPEATWRQNALHNGGLQKDPDGLYRLHVNRKEEADPHANCDL